MTNHTQQTKQCEVCDVDIVRSKKLSQKQWDRKRFCSFSCGGKHMRSKQSGSWTKGLKCPQLSGENHYRWKGGITDENDKLRHSKEWRDWRSAVFVRDDFMCQACGKRGGDLQADHVMPRHLYPDMTFDILNGRTLCVPCHRETDTFGHKVHSFDDYETALSKI